MFRRVATLLVLSLVLGACARETTSTTRPRDTSPDGSPSDAETEPNWTRVTVEDGPSSRIDYSLTGDGNGLYLFGGRSSGKPLGDLWSFDLGTSTWRRIEASGPEARFGHNSVIKDGKLMIFGGQAGSTFFDDLWTFDPASMAWSKFEPTKSPARRYGAGGTLVENQFVISHGFTFEGRFDDTWSFESDWQDVSPESGSRPVKRCLHRIVHLGDGKVLLFGGQTNGQPFLGDTWIYDVDSRSWVRSEVDGPSARNLFAFASHNGKAYLFGGRTADGSTGDLWSFDGSKWSELSVAGPPDARSGIEAAIVDNKMFVFGGAGGGGKEFDDLWQLALP